MKEIPCKDCLVLVRCITRLHDSQSILGLSDTCCLLSDYIYTRNMPKHYDKIYNYFISINGILKPQTKEKNNGNTM